MTERPIIFSAPMVRAILEGRKTQTRRIAPIDDIRFTHHDGGMITWSVHFVKPYKRALSSHSGGRFSEDETRRIIAAMYCPYGQPGDRLWVREAHAIVPRTAYAASDGVQQILRPHDEHDAAIFRDGWDRSTGGLRWRPSIHMPRWASRILLEVTGVRVERLQDISEADARAEGARECDPVSSREVLLAGPSQRGSFVLHYRDIWQQINGEGSWDANPWVWVVEFERVKP